MSNVSKLVIKACSDNKFSSFIGEFITSINPENLVIKSAVSYHVPENMTSSSLLKYRGSPPKLLSFSLLFDNTGIIPGSNAISVMQQIKQLQDVAYSIHKKNNAPNYIRVIWGQIDFKGRLVDLDIVYSMFQVDGTLVRAEAHIAVLEEVVPLGAGKSVAGVDGKYAQVSSANAVSKQKTPISQGPSSKEHFAPTPNGMNGPYSGAPSGAYDGSADQVYHGSNDAGNPVYASSRVNNIHSTNSTSSPPTAITNSGSSMAGTAPSSTSTTAMDRRAGGSKGGIAGNGPGGSGGGVGGGGHEPGSTPTKSPSSVDPSTRKHPTTSGSGGVPTKAQDGFAKKSSSLAAGVVGGAAAVGVAAAAASVGANSLRNLKTKATGLNFLRRIKNFAKKVAPRAYNAGKKVVKSSGF